MIDEAQKILLERYLDLLLAANQTMNLTAVTERAAAQTVHIDDALTLLPFLPAGRCKLADIGTGGGSPAFVVAIARPDIHVTCIESTKKKAAFLQTAAGELGLGNISVYAERAETAEKKSFDVVTARAVGSMENVAQLGLPLLRAGGVLLAMKGRKIAEELPAAMTTIRRLGGGKPVVHAVELAGTDSHVVVEIRKMGKGPL